MSQDADGRRYSRPATREDVKRLVRALNDAGADYLLVGGYALLALGFERATTDIDVLLPRDRGTGELIDRRSGFSCLAQHPVSRLSLPAPSALRVSCGPSSGQRTWQSQKAHGSLSATASLPGGTVKTKVAQ